MNDFLFYLAVVVILLVLIVYIFNQIQLSKELSLKDTTLDGLEEKLKKHKLIGGRHKRTNKKNPPIV
tara:strand:+ start:485 stop:685 length:201 start_codon:yes stop_codon:yes gene_type:complete